MKKPFTLLVGVAALLLSAVPASAAFQNLTGTVQNGTLVVSGRSNTGTSVVLDDQFSAPLTGGGAYKNFSFSLIYLPSDCIVDLTLVGAPQTSQVVIANCGPRGLNPRGDWSGAATYVLDDIVTYNGSSWRALFNPTLNTGMIPDAGTSTGFWEKFVSRGLEGAVGATGPEGSQGLQGPQGDTGPQGLQGEIGPVGLQGPQGEVGPQGLQGPAGPTIPVIPGVGGAYTVTASVKLEGTFSAIVIGADSVDIDARDATIDCGSAASTVGINFGTHSRVRVKGGNITGCMIGALIGGVFAGGTAGNSNHIEGVTFSDSVDAGDTHFPGQGVMINNGVNNRVSGNTFIRGCTGIGLALGQNNHIKDNDVQTSRSDCWNQGIVMQDSPNNIISGNSVTSLNGYGIFVLGSVNNLIFGNIANGNLYDLNDTNSSCTLNVWRNNVFTVDHGPESDGPGAGCMQ